MKLRQLRPVGERTILPSLADVWTTSRRASATLTDVAASSIAANAQARRFEFLWLNSATAALAAVLRAARDAKGVSHPEAIIPAFACPDIVAAAVHAGVRPVLADFLPDSATIDPSDVAAARSSRTVAVVSVRLLGLPGNADALRQALGSDCPTLIEDCAHVPLSDVFETSADAVVVSFGRGKPASLRRGGLLLTSRHAGLDVQCADGHMRNRRVEALQHWLEAALYNRAISPGVYWFLTRVCGIPVDAISYRPLEAVRPFPDYLASTLPLVLARQFRHGDELAKSYSGMLRRMPGPWIDLGSQPAGDEEQCAHLWRYPLLLSTQDQRERLFDLLWRRGLGPSRLYLKCLSELTGTAPLVAARAHPQAGSFATRLLTLPLHSDVTLQDAADMEDCLRHFTTGTSHCVSIDTRPASRSQSVSCAPNSL